MGAHREILGHACSIHNCSQQLPCNHLAGLHRLVLCLAGICVSVGSGTSVLESHCLASNRAAKTRTDKTRTDSQAKAGLSAFGPRTNAKVIVPARYEKT
jgi:hypothetical protein